MANIRIIRNTTKSWTGYVTSAGAPRDISTDVIYMTVKSSPSLADAAALFQLSIADGITYTSATLGQYAITIAPGKTASCPATRTVYFYDITIIYAGGDKYPLESGYFIVEPNVTSATS